jgi:hypothetical protein
LDASGYVLPFVSHPIPCLANFKEPVTWQKLFGALQNCQEAKTICQDTTFGVGLPTSPDEVPMPKSEQVQVPTEAPSQAPTQSSEKPATTSPKAAN